MSYYPDFTVLLLSAVVTGWGRLQYYGSSPDQLQEVTVSVLSNHECSEKYSTEEITDSMLCAGEVGKDSCQGESKSNS